MGIVTAIARRNVVPVLLEGLRKLEYRGYDSAGLAVLEDRRPARLQRLRPSAASPNWPPRPRHRPPPTSASPTPAGPPTACPPSATPTRTFPGPGRGA